MDLRNQRPTMAVRDAGRGDPRDAIRRELNPNNIPPPLTPEEAAAVWGDQTPARPIQMPQAAAVPPAPVPPSAPISLPPEAFRDPSQFVTPIQPPTPPPMSLAPNSQEIDIPQIRNQAPQLPQSLPSGVPGIEIRPGNKMPIRGRYRF